MKEVVFSAKLLPAGESFCQPRYTFTVAFILIGKYLLAEWWGSPLGRLALLPVKKGPEPYLFTHILGA